MKVLWICNIPIPIIAEDCGLPVLPVGGWMVHLSKQLCAREDISLVYAFPTMDAQARHGVLGNLRYTSFYEDCTNRHYDKNRTRNALRRIIADVEPDVIHLHGTEFAHTYHALRICEELGCLPRVAVSIQGIISEYAKHSRAYLPTKIVHGHALRDLISGNVRAVQRIFARQGRDELAALALAQHVLGRTAFDQAMARFHAPNAQYHVHNETLRAGFYEAKPWAMETCEPYTIFTSQGSYPHKGLHLLIEALGLLAQQNPAATLYIGGENIAAIPGWKRSTYHSYLLRRIAQLRLQDRVVFLGPMQEADMIAQFLRAHVYASASAIENSSNSVGEAMLLGLPVVSSFVGGVPSMLTHEQEGLLYPADSPLMLAQALHLMFSNTHDAQRMARNARTRALQTHDPHFNLEVLLSTYRSIAQMPGVLPASDISGSLRV